MKIHFQPFWTAPHLDPWVIVHLLGSAALTSIFWIYLFPAWLAMLVAFTLGLLWEVLGDGWIGYTYQPLLTLSWNDGRREPSLFYNRICPFWLFDHRGGDGWDLVFDIIGICLAFLIGDLFFV